MPIKLKKILFIFIVLTYSCNGSNNVVCKKFEILELDLSKIGSQRFAIYDHSSWVKFWSDYGQGDRPKVDFSKYNIVGIFLGERGNPGYSIEIGNTWNSNNQLNIDYIEYLPNPSKGYIQVIVYPYELLICSKKFKEINFIKRQKIQK